MKRHWAYLKYVLRHKYYVFVACRVLRVPLWRALVHDWTKFLPSEWGPYASTFYKPDGSKQYVPSPEFTYAWRHHQRRNLHHWQAWLITWDHGKTECLDMLEPYVSEMVADWFGAGRAITGEWGAKAWYEKQKDRIQLGDLTRKRVEELLKVADGEFNYKDMYKQIYG